MIELGKATESVLCNRWSFASGQRACGGEPLPSVSSVAAAISKAAAGSKQTKSLVRIETGIKSPKHNWEQERAEACNDDGRSK